MSDDVRKQAVLAARARKLAQREAETGARRVLARVMVVDVAREHVGIEVAHVREVIPSVPVTPVGQAPKCVEGIGSLRGELVSVADLADLLDRGRAVHGRYMAVVEAGTRAIALRIDGVVGLRDLYEEDFVPGLGDAEVVGLVRAVTADLVSLLDVERMLQSERVVGAVGRASHVAGTRGERA